METQSVNNDIRWDGLVRLCHWLMVILIGTAWYTAENGMMQWHYYAGYGLIAIVIIRVIWGFVGSRPARFTQFVKNPFTVLRYLKNIKQNNAKGTPATHSPAGGYSVIALLSLMLVQTTSGLFSVETDGFDGGPLSEEIDYDLALEISEFHTDNFDILLAFIILHIIAVMFYQKVLKQPIIQKMSPFKSKNRK